MKRTKFTELKLLKLTSLVHVFILEKSKVDIGKRVFSETVLCDRLTNKTHNK